MILYVDTSALVKLYVEESGSDDVSSAVVRAERVLTSRIAYPEARAAFARARREGSLTQRELRAAVEELDRDWGTYDIVELTEPLVRRAGALAEKRALRGFDAVHLAAAIVAVGEPKHAEFACYDGRLSRAAEAEGFCVVGE